MTDDEEREHMRRMLAVLKVQAPHMADDREYRLLAAHDALEAALREARAERDVASRNYDAACERRVESDRRALAAEATLSAVRKAWGRYSDGTLCGAEKHNRPGWDHPGQMLDAERKADGCTCGLAALVRLLEQGDQSPVTPPKCPCGRRYCECSAFG